jgi:hypothetical protein
MLMQRFVIMSGAGHLASAIGLDNAQAVAKQLGARFAPMPDPDWIQQESNSFFVLGDSENYSYFPAWLNDDLARIKKYENRFALLKRESETAPWRVSYVARPEAPQGKRRNVIDLTRYLAKYYGITSDKARDMFRRIMGETLELHHCDKPETFEELYSVCLVLFSCMNGRDEQGNEKFKTLPCHPAAIYGAGDIGIAWLYCTVSQQVIARAVYNKRAKAYPRVYGTCEGMESLHERLKREGFTHDDNALEGCKLSKIETRRGFIMPYLDGIQTVADHGDHWIICEGGEDGEADQTNGKMRGGSRYTCDSCGDRMNEDECHHVNGDIWCESCYESNTFFCEYYEEPCADSEGAVSVNTRRGNTQIWSRDAADNYAFCCDYSGEYYDSRYFTEIEVRERYGTTTACLEESSDFFFECEETGEYYATQYFTAIEVGSATWCKEATSTVYCAMCGEYYPVGEKTRGFDVCSDGMACPIDGPGAALAFAASLVGFVA